MRIYLYFFVFVIFSSFSYSQVTNNGQPVSWSLNLDNQVEKISLPNFDLEAIKAEDAINDYKFESPWRFGYMHSVDYGFDDGVWTVLENGDRIWKDTKKLEKAATGPMSSSTTVGQDLSW